MKKEKNIKALPLLLIGACSGIINGFFGAGGGLLIVPMLKKTNVGDSKIVHATTLACVMLMCFCSGIVYFFNKKIEINIVLWCLIGSIIGGIVGTKLLKKLKNKAIDFIFSIVLIVAGVAIIIF